MTRDNLVCWKCGASLDEIPLPLSRRAECPGCGAEIKAHQNVPVLSYLFLGGQCANCRQSISVRYPIVEVLTALLAALCAWRFGFGWEALMAIALTCALVAVSLIDIDHQIIPDSIVLPFLWVGLFMSLFHPLPGAETLFISPQDAIVGALAGYLSLWSVYQLFKLVTGKEGMGFGDFKLLAALGAWLGWQQLHIIILMSAIVGAIVGIALMVARKHGREIPIPFGPYLALAAVVGMLALNGLKNQEIADELDISLNTVKTQKKIAYSKLKDRLGHRFNTLLLSLL